MFLNHEDVRGYAEADAMTLQYIITQFAITPRRTRAISMSDL